MGTMNLDGGISGCKLELDDKILIKYSSSIDYNQRLRTQMDKQIFFYNKKLYRIQVPKVFSSGYKGDLFFFDMEYVPGLAPMDLFITTDKTQLDHFLYCLYEYFDYQKDNQKQVGFEYFRNRNISKLDSLFNTSSHKDFISYLKEKLLEYQGNITFKSFCHGDFTGSNMIYFNQHLYLIDFLDSHVDSIQIDLVKLKQEFYYKWTLMNSNDFDQCEILRIHQVSDYIWEKIYERYKCLIETFEFQILECLNFLRIEPYIKNENMKLILEKIIKKIPTYEEFDYSNGR